ncbi:MAG: hypothetical protein N3B18_04320 [Desulfobacterota bacterium]|nr:hypothetical protein [Thermodesulfobacteriota bacterium]
MNSADTPGKESDGITRSKRFGCSHRQKINVLQTAQLAQHHKIW